MALTVEDVERVAALARIAVDGQQVQEALQHLNAIFRLIEDMQAVDVSGVEPMSHGQDVMQRLRDDVVTERDERDRLQALAPRSEDGLYLVPRVIE